jgi:hypothetical protein
MACGRVKGTGHIRYLVWWPPPPSGLRGNDRNPKGRDAKRLGCARGAGERSLMAGDRVKGTVHTLDHLNASAPTATSHEER